MNHIVSGRSAFKALLVPVVAGTLAAGNLAAPAQAAAAKLPASGRVTYNLKNSMLSGSMAVSWAEGGKKMRQDIRMNLPAAARRASNGRPASITGWTIYDGTNVYTHMPEMGATGAKRVMRLKLSPAQARRMMLGAFNSLGAQTGGGKLVGKATVLGKPCEIREATMNNRSVKARTRMWLWQNLPLRIESTMQVSGMPAGGRAGAPQTRTIKTTVVATNINTSAKPSPTAFKVPAGYQVQDMKMPPSLGGPR